MIKSVFSSSPACFAFIAVKESFNAGTQFKRLLKHRPGNLLAVRAKQVAYQQLAASYNKLKPPLRALRLKTFESPENKIENLSPMSSL
jgi:hypothetical protein